MPVYRIQFSGCVQGVGFRATCAQLARTLPALVGEVCNLRDGRVQLLVRGPAADVDRLIERLKDTFPGYIDDVQKNQLAAEDDPLPPGLAGIHITRC
jgi:acylphosphatase